MIGWIVGGITAWLAVAASNIAMCKAAARGDQAHAHHPPLDADQAAWDDLVRRLEGPTSWCATCAHPTANDRLWCSNECQSVWERP